MCDRFPWTFDAQTSYEPSNVIFVVNIKFSRAAYHTIVPSTEELYCLNSEVLKYLKTSQSQTSFLHYGNS